MRFCIIYAIENCEKHSSRNVYFLQGCPPKHAILLKVKLHHGCFSRFLNCANGTKLQSIAYIFDYTALLKFYEWYECSRNLGLRQSLETGYTNMTFLAKALFFNKITRCHKPLSNDVALVNKQLHCNQMQ